MTTNSLTPAQIAEAGLIKHVMVDGEQVTLRSAEDIIRLNEYLKANDIGCSKSKRQASVRNMFAKVNSTYFE